MAALNIYLCLNLPPQPGRQVPGGDTILSIQEVINTFTFSRELLKALKRQLDICSAFARGSRNKIFDATIVQKGDEVGFTSFPGISPADRAFSCIVSFAGLSGEPNPLQIQAPVKLDLPWVS